MNHIIPTPKGDGTDWCQIVTKAASSDDAETSAEVRIYDEIGYWGTTAKRFADQLAELDVDRIDLHVNSPGGNAWDGVAIMNTLRRNRARVEVTVDGIAASAASLICMAGDHITMAGSSQIMIHDGSAIAWGNAQAMRETADLLDKVSDSYADAYARRAGGTRAEWREVMRAETWYTAEEAVLAGLADLWDGSTETPAAASFDLSRFTHAGRSAAPAPPLPMSMAAIKPPAEPDKENHPNRKEDEMSESPFKAGLRERLGITDPDVDEAAILATLDEVLAEQAAPNTPQAAAPLPEGVVTIDKDVLAELQASATEVRTIRAERDKDRREGLVRAAIQDGRIPPARRDHWMAQLEADEEGAGAVLANLTPGTIPLSEKGHSGDGDDLDEDSTYNKYFPKEA